MKIALHYFIMSVLLILFQIDNIFFHKMELRELKRKTLNNSNIFVTKCEFHQWEMKLQVDEDGISDILASI